jgi:hypothetical protein
MCLYLDEKSYIDPIICESLSDTETTIETVIVMTDDQTEIPIYRQIDHPCFQRDSFSSPVSDL